MTRKHPIPIFSDKFGDYYFSRDNGLAETQYVFLGGNNLPDAWRDHDRFVIAETGFGTGMNFLSTWELFDKTSRRGRSLHYIAAELYPLDIHILKKFLRPLFGVRAERFLAQYPFLTPGYHRLQLAENVTLTLIFDDVVEAFRLLDANVNCWFLDGFVPAGNPEMWRQELFDRMATLSAEGASFATFTAAGFVRRGLMQAGFEVEKTKGYGKKREMLKGRFPAGRPSEPKNTPGRIAIIGGGLAGAAAAYALGQRGYSPILYEKGPHLAGGASGNARGLFNPRPFAQRHPRCEFHTAGLELIARTARHLANEYDISYRLPGCLHLTDTPDKVTRHAKALGTQDTPPRGGMGWPVDLLRRVEAGEASAIARVKIPVPCLWSPLAGAVSPPRLVRAYAAGCEVRLNHDIHRVQKHDGAWALMDQTGQTVGQADTVILTRPVDIEGAAIDWPALLRPVRGQITEIAAPSRLAGLRCNIAHGGYLSRAADNRLIMGATFQRGREDSKPDPEDNYRNFYQTRLALGHRLMRPDFRSHRASVRLTTPDHMPLAGPLQTGNDGLYISAGWGSHGLLGTILGAHLLADQMDGTPKPIPKNVVGALDPKRFLENT